MPATLTYPGVYIEEIPSGVRTITGVATSITAFLGRVARGPANEPVTINSFGDFDRQFGGLDVNYPLSYAVRDFYLNGGAQAIIVRLEKSSAKAKNDDVKLEAASPGIWGNALVYVVDAKGVTDDVASRFGIAKTDLFNLTIYENPGNGSVEQFLNVAVVAGAGSRRLDHVLAKADLFNLLCIPPDTRGGDTSAGVYQGAMEYCAKRRAILIVDPPAAWGANKDTAAAKAVAGLSTLGLTGVDARNA